jgi:hypothetical protein
MTKKLLPEEMGKNLEDFAQDAKLLEEARSLGQRTNREVAESLEKSPHDGARAREMGRRAAEAFAKAEAEEKEKEKEKDKEEEKKAKMVALAPRRLYRWVGPAAIAASVLALFGFERDAIVLWFSGPIVTSPFDGGPNYERARKLQEEAWNDYRDGRFAECLQKLDEAKVLYPDGDKDPDVERLRKNAGMGLAGDAGPRGSQE